MRATERSLTEVLEVRNTPVSEIDILASSLPIVEKVNFATGVLQLRETSGTRTPMVLAQPGDLVVSGINAHQGAVALLDPASPTPVAATIHYSTYRVREGADPVYVWHLLRTKLFRDRLVSSLPGGIKTEAKAERLLRIMMPLPSLGEQRAAVDRLTRGLLCSAELARLVDTRPRWLRSLVPALLDEQVGRAPSVPMSEVLAEPIRNGWSPVCNSEGDGTPVLTLAAVTGNRFDASQVKYTNEPLGSREDCLLTSGDMLVTRSNTPELVGHAAVYEGLPEVCIFPDLMMRCRFVEEVSPRFAALWMQAPTVRRRLTRRAKGTSQTMTKIRQSDLEGLPFPKIDLKVQQELLEWLHPVERKIHGLLDLDTQATRLLGTLPAALRESFTVT